MDSKQNSVVIIEINSDDVETIDAIKQQLCSVQYELVRIDSFASIDLTQIIIHLIPAAAAIITTVIMKNKGKPGVSIKIEGIMEATVETKEELKEIIELVYSKKKDNNE